ncbi:NUDIX hydrolase [Methyloraptor flagellatus]|jgi:8-oxo-dGTP diphosphatase|uniref:NUDIX hydrolase n=1 Tax=Methyloraptor flagellatus TaxID=3162530 RepID=A0AAU7X7U9_9HYPH
MLAVSICVFRRDEVLLVERGKPPGVGLWSPVGGRVEWGETLEAAALREVAEETGVNCRIVGLSHIREIIHTESTPGFHAVLAVHAAEWTSGEPVAGDDARDARFVALTDLETLPLVEGVVPHILRAHALLERHA